MSISWTEKQRRAIEKSGCNLIVCAAAGSGKTAVLVERIIRKISDGKTDIDSLLITTFTEAAASKMRADIKAAIDKKLEENPADKHLARQALLINRAEICTIHAFCMRVIKQHFQSLDLDPDFRICDENEAKLLKEQAAKEVFEECYESADEGFYELLDAYSNQRGDDNLRGIALELHSFVKSMPFYENWMRMAEADYDSLTDFENTKFYKKISQNLNIMIKKHISAFRIASEDADFYDGLDAYSSAFMEDIAQLEALQKKSESGTIEQIAHLLEGFKLTAARAKKGAPEDVKEYFRKLRESARGDIKAMHADYFCDFEVKLSKLKESKSKVQSLFELVRKIDARFGELKRKRSVIDFNDIEHFCLEILADTDENGEVTPSAAALGLKEKYTEILVDEYQDANKMQETIFSLISRGNNIFMVGDLKQSIYRFRHTDPSLFKQKMNTYSDEDGDNQRVIMAENFRSRKGVIDCVNFIFEQISSETVGEITYDKRERLNFAAIYPEAEKINCGGSSELILVSGSEDAEYDEYDENTDEASAAELARFEAEAQAVCRKIKELKASGFMVFDKNEGYRPLKLKDIVVLMRSPKSDAAALANIMEQNRIDCFADVGGGYFDSEEIGVIMNILTVIDNPRQDIALLAVMRSPIFSFDEAELTKIRIFTTEGDIYKALESYTKGGDEKELSEKCSNLIGKLKKWRKWSVYMPAHELIDAIYTDTGYFAYVGAMPGGEVRRANLRLLYKRAEAYEATSYKGLFNFIRFVEKMAKTSKDSQGARLLGENQDVVRIMSIHKSKGLEFPVVFLVGMSKRFNLRDLSKPVLVHKDLGIGMDYIDCSLRYKTSLPIKNVIADVQRDELLSEELRLLYVALTRAREKLIMCAYVPNLKKSLAKWERTASEAESLSLPVYRCRQARCFSDWVIPALMRCDAGRRLTVGAVAGTGSEIDLKIETVTETAHFEDVIFSEPADRAEGADCDAAKILDFSYPNPKAAHIARKLSVTELKRIINTPLDGESYLAADAVMDELPEFLSEGESLSGAQRGSVTHYIMQKISFEKMPEKKDIVELASNLYKDGFLSEAQHKAVNAEAILRFFETDIAKRMLKAERLEREIPFEINISASEVYADYTGDEKILLQGIIDCYFKEGDTIVLLDYKTDSLKNTTAEALAAKYKTQLDFYAKALAKMTGCENIEKYIYFFAGKTVEVEN